MIQLSQTIQAWGTTEFHTTLKTEIENLSRDVLPLQQGLSRSSHVANTQHTAILLSVSDDDHSILVRLGICYAGIIAGCSCADDPTPLNENPEYCVIQLNIDKLTGHTSVQLIATEDN